MGNGEVQVVKINGWRKTTYEWFWKAMYTLISQKYWISLIAIWIIHQLMVTKHTYDLINSNGEVVTVNAPYLNGVDGGNYIQLIVVAFLAIRSIPVVIQSVGDAMAKVKNGHKE